MDILNQLKAHPFMVALFLISFFSLTLIFLIGVYKFALVILISLILGFVGYLLDRSEILSSRPDR